MHAVDYNQDHKLNISEMFYSIQGEGPTRGNPAVFVRTQGCNFMCGGSGGSLVKEGKATWYCDSEVIWKKGTEYDYNKFKMELISMIPGSLYNHNLPLSIIWTGGEPTMPRNAKGILYFMHRLKIDKYFKDINFFWELETNGSLSRLESLELFAFIDQINCSAKLSNSGMSKTLRINEEALKAINDTPNSVFKFVVSCQEDWYEIKEDYLPFIDMNKIVLMPAVDNVDDVQKTGEVVWKMAEQLGVRMTLRDHIIVWNKTVGV